MKKTLCTLTMLMILALGLGGCSKPQPDEMLIEAAQLMQSGEFFTAELKYQDFLKAYPGHEFEYFAHQGLASCYIAKGDFAGAREELKKIEAQQGLESEIGFKARISYIDSFLQQSDFNQALSEALATSETLTQAVAPEAKLSLQIKLADIYRLSGDLGKAREQLWSLAGRPQNRPELEMMLLKQLTQLGLEAGDTEAVKTIYDRYLERNPNPDFKPELMFSKAWTLRQIGEQALANEAFAETEALYQQRYEEALGADQKVASLAGLSRVQTMTNQFDAALASLNTAINDYPTAQMRPMLIFKLGELKMNLGKIDEAIEALNIIVTEYPGTQDSNQAQSAIEQLRNAPPESFPALAAMASTATLQIDPVTTQTMVSDEVTTH